MSDGPQKLTNALIEQRRAVEPQPGSADNEWELRRDRNAELVLVGADLSRLGGGWLQPRMLLHPSIAGVAGAVGLVALSHPAGFYVSRAQNLTSLFCCIAQFPDLGAVRALAGFAASGTTVISGFRTDPNLTILSGTTTAAQPLGFELTSNVQPGSIWEPVDPLWVEPGRVFAITNHVLVATLLDLNLEVFAPTTLGNGT